MRKADMRLIVAVAITAVIAFLAAYILAWSITDCSHEAEAARQDGYLSGIDYAITSVYSQTEGCQSSVITVGNKSRQLVDVACLVPA